MRFELESRNLAQTSLRRERCNDRSGSGVRRYEPVSSPGASNFAPTIVGTPQAGRMMLKTGSVMRPWVERAAASGALWLLGFGALGCEKPAPEPAAQRAPSTTPKSDPADSVADAPARRLPSCLVPTPITASPAPWFAVDPKCPVYPAGGSPMLTVVQVAFPQ